MAVFYPPPPIAWPRPFAAIPAVQGGGATVVPTRGQGSLAQSIAWAPPFLPSQPKPFAPSYLFPPAATTDWGFLRRLSDSSAAAVSVSAPTCLVALTPANVPTGVTSQPLPPVRNTAFEFSQGAGTPYGAPQELTITPVFPVTPPPEMGFLINAQARDSKIVSQVTQAAIDWRLPPKIAQTLPASPPGFPRPYARNAALEVMAGTIPPFIAAQHMASASPVPVIPPAPSGVISIQMSTFSAIGGQAMP